MRFRALPAGILAAWAFLICSYLYCQNKVATLPEKAARKGFLHEAEIVDYIGCCRDIDERIQKSDLIVGAQVIDEKATLNPAQTEVYTDYTVQIDDVYKGMVNPGARLLVQKRGGRISVDGHPIQIDVRGSPMLLHGSSYILFLSKCITGICTAPYLLTYQEAAVELKDGRVACPAKPGETTQLFRVYCGMSHADFLTALKEKIVAANTAK